MDIYHAIRGFIECLFHIPFWLVGLVLYSLGYLTAGIGGVLIGNFSIRSLNIMNNYRNCKESDESSNEYHKWTGRRIK